MIERLCEDKGVEEVVSSMLDGRLGMEYRTTNVQRSSRRKKEGRTLHRTITGVRRSKQKQNIHPKGQAHSSARTSYNGKQQLDKSKISHDPFQISRILWYSHSLPPYARPPTAIPIPIPAHTAPTNTSTNLPTGKLTLGVLILSFIGFHSEAENASRDGRWRGSSGSGSE